MAHFEDLQPCGYFPQSRKAPRAIGWLTRDARFPQGAVSKEFFENLQALCSSPWQPFVVSMGVHHCELCQFDPPAFSSNLFVPFQGCIFVAPVAITHYVSVHWYRPPDVFIQAVAECPSTSSMEYKKAILENGGRSLIKAIVPKSG
ncbi:MAG TPA: hypothetical protein VGJ26_21240 [Pirellulales bacterium]|jgi:hypothetical protein